MTARPQTAIGAALGRAGFNTIEMRLRQVILDALRKHHRNIPRALETVEHATEDDPELIREALLWAVCRLDSEMLGAGQALIASHFQNAGAQQTNRDGVGQNSNGARISVAHPVREPSTHDRAAAGRVAKTLVITVFDRVKTSDGRPWGNVGAHELDGMSRDGSIALAIKSKLGPLSNRQRFQTLRELMNPAEFEIIVQAAREQSSDA